MEKLFKKNISYPKTTNKNFQSKIYKKREFYSHKIPEREQLNTYEEIKEYRDKICGKNIVPHEYQTFLSKYINPNTPYRGILIFHGVGSGKTCGSIKIAENFKPLVEKYGTKIHVLVPGSLVKENWKNEIVKCTGNTYLKVKNKNEFQSKNEIKQNIKEAHNIITKYYKFISYKSFHKKVLGEKIREKVTVGNKVIKKFRKTKDGDYERDVSVDRIEYLNNSLIIIDEAHHLTDNDIGDALLKVIHNSVNLKIVLLTATPMKNLADDIIYLINFIRPKNDKISRDKVFTSEKGHKMKFKEGGIKYLKDMTRGYVSYVRGADPLTFAEKVDKGEVPPGLLFTKLVRCPMLDFQLNVYNQALKSIDDALDKRTTSVSNFVFPGIENDKLVGLYGTDGINTIKNQLKSYNIQINENIKKNILNTKNDNMDYIYLDNEKTITGKFLELDNLKHFSIKFNTILKNLNKLINDRKGTAFIYSNYVKVGIEIFEQILLQNGCLEFNEDQNNYNIQQNTKCYYCGKEFNKHPIPDHEFYPITFISITGASEDNIYAQHEDKMRIINIFNNINNKDGKYIKYILGSQVMSESITLENIKEVHIVDAHYHLGRVDQVIGRAIRYCKHYAITNEKNPYPKVNVYRYVVSIKDGLSTEEILYKKAEQKYKLIKKVEHILKTNAVDCPLFRNINIFPEEVEQYKDCGTADKPCPEKCNFTSCNYQCEDNTLNELYYDKKKNIYKDIKQENLDVSTFSNKLARDEIDYIKTIIKKIYKIKNYYLLSDIIDNVYNLYDPKKRKIYDKNFTYYALTELMPQNENDFNNFNDIIYNKFNEPGYIIQRNKYYIFQSFNDYENTSMYDRDNYNINLVNKLSLYTYIKNTNMYNKVENKTEKKVKFQKYDFDSVMSYYDKRKSFNYIGIIDKDKKNNEVFKIKKIYTGQSTKKRGIGITTLTGATCHNAFDKNELLDIIKLINTEIKKLKLNTKINNNIKNKNKMCDYIKEKLLFLEINANNNTTYVMIPANHPTYKFPLNKKK